MNKRTRCCKDDWVCDRSMEVGFQSLSIIHFNLFRLQGDFSVRMTCYPTIIIDAHLQRGYRTPHKSTSYTPSRGLTLISDSSATGLDAQPSPPSISKKKRVTCKKKALTRRSTSRQVIVEEATSIWKKRASNHPRQPVGRSHRRRLERMVRWWGAMNENGSCRWERVGEE